MLSVKVRSTVKHLVRKFEGLGKNYRTKRERKRGRRKAPRHSLLQPVTSNCVFARGAGTPHGDDGKISSIDQTILLIPKTRADIATVPPCIISNPEKGASPKRQPSASFSTEGIVKKHVMIFSRLATEQSRAAQQLTEDVLLQKAQPATHAPLPYALKASEDRKSQVDQRKPNGLLTGVKGIIAAMNHRHVATTLSLISPSENISRIDDQDSANSGQDVDNYRGVNFKRHHKPSAQRCASTHSRGEQRRASSPDQLNPLRGNEDKVKEQSVFGRRTVWIPSPSYAGDHRLPFYDWLVKFGSLKTLDPSHLPEIVVDNPIGPKVSAQGQCGNCRPVAVQRKKKTLMPRSLSCALSKVRHTSKRQKGAAINKSEEECSRDRKNTPYINVAVASGDRSFGDQDDPTLHHAKRKAPIPLYSVTASASTNSVGSFALLHVESDLILHRDGEGQSPPRTPLTLDVYQGNTAMKRRKLSFRLSPNYDAARHTARSRSITNALSRDCRKAKLRPDMAEQYVKQGFLLESRQSQWERQVSPLRNGVRATAAPKEYKYCEYTHKRSPNNGICSEQKIKGGSGNSTAKLKVHTTEPGSRLLATAIPKQDLGLISQGLRVTSWKDRTLPQSPVENVPQPVVRVLTEHDEEFYDNSSYEADDDSEKESDERDESDEEIGSNKENNGRRSMTSIRSHDDLRGSSFVLISERAGTFDATAYAALNSRTSFRSNESNGSTDVASSHAANGNDRSHSSSSGGYSYHSSSSANPIIGEASDIPLGVLFHMLGGRGSAATIHEGERRRVRIPILGKPPKTLLSPRPKSLESMENMRRLLYRWGTEGRSKQYVQRSSFY
ncbi:MAG: hypothetical protein M1827_004156 [Pycnora praestabilis]|nr:MAG: hypothetical protein M1827_004156 [Pycnora praestabilis]